MSNITANTAQNLEALYQKTFTDFHSPLHYLDTIQSIKVYIKRDDLNHPTIQGNKLRKLKHNIRYIIDNKISSVLSFGGAYSNHIHALAHASKLFSFHSIAIIRGEELANPRTWGKTLQDCHQLGMQLHFVSRQNYRLKSKTVALEALSQKIDNLLVLPEGGNNTLARLGSGEIINECILALTKEGISTHHSHSKNNCYLLAACGTGGTLAGMIKANQKQDNPLTLIGIPILKNAQFLYDDIAKMQINKEQISLNCDYHFGGYAKITPTLLKFKAEFENRYQIALDNVYTAKLCFAVFDLINNGFFNQDSNVIIYHSGGLQGTQESPAEKIKT